MNNGPGSPDHNGAEFQVSRRMLDTLFNSIFIRVNPCSMGAVRHSTALILRLKRMWSFDTDEHG